LPEGRSTEDYTDEEPWEFPKLKAFLNSAVADGIAGAKSRDILDHMRAFTVLQRLFRVALAERLGPRFPIERLEELARLSAPRVASSRTPRWNPRPGYIEMILARQLTSIHRDLQAEGPATSAAASALSRCISRIEASSAPELIPSAVWATDCGQSIRPPQGGSPTIQRRIEVANTLMTRARQSRELRRALGVWRDDEHARQGAACPAM
jgi:hypothetical protein